MQIITRSGCPICTRDVSGNRQLGYLCGSCGVLFSSRMFRDTQNRKELVETFTVYVRSMDSDTYHVPGCKYARRIEEPIELGADDVSSLRACRCVKQN